MARQRDLTRKQPTRTGETREAAVSAASLSVYEESFFAGPLPPPEALARYEQICPGAAERILKMAEQQAVHRQAIEKAAILSKGWVQKVGPILGFILSLAVIGVGYGFVLQGKELYGFASLLLALGSVVVPFITGKSYERKEIEQKRQGLMLPPPDPAQDKQSGESGH
jgi:uncharacterized membrane protein